MAGLIEIADLTETVRFRDREIPVGGLSVGGIASLLARFPDLRKALSGGGFDFDVETLLALGPEIVAAILADGLEIGEDVAARLPLALQIEAIEIMVRLTMPEGLGPFVERIERLMGDAGPALSAGAPSTSSGKRSKG